MGASGLDNAEIVERVAEACRYLGRLNLTNGSAGHVSYYLSESNTMLIKGKGEDEADLSFTQPEDIIEVDANADKVAGARGLRSPNEAFLHFWMFKKYPQLRSVVHVHPKYSVLLTMCDIPLVPIGSYDIPGGRLAVEGVPRYERTVTIHDDELGEEFAEFMGPKKVALMHGHGITVTGSGIEEATLRTISFEESAKFAYLADVAGGIVHPLSEGEIDERFRIQHAPRTRGSAQGEAGLQASWRKLQTRMAAMG